MAAVLILSIALIPVYAEYSFTAEQTAILQAMGVYSGSEDLNAEITKGEFAKLLITALRDGDEIIPDTESPFSDVDSLSDNYAEIWLLQKCGVVSADINSEFNQDEPQYTEDALEMTASVLGYSRVLMNYRVKNAYTALGLNDKVTTMGRALDYYNACMILVNTVKADILNIPYFQYKKLYKVSGVVTDDGARSYNGRSTLGEENIKIGEEVYVNNSGEEDLFGLSVIGYCKEDRSTKESILLSAVKSNRNKIVNVQSNLIEKFDKDTKTYTYSENEYSKTKRITASSGAIIVYNQEVTDINDTAFNIDMFIPESGMIRFYDNDGNGVWDLVFIEDYETRVVSYVDEKNEIIYVKNNYAPLKLEDYEYKIRDKYGDKLEISSLSENSVLSVAENLKKDRYVIYASKESTQDMIVSKDANSRIIKTRMDGEYTLSPYFEKTTGIINLKTGTPYTFWFDMFGEVAYAVASSDNSWNVGFIIKAWKDEDADNDETYYVRLYELDNKIVDIKLAKKVLIYDEDDLYARDADSYKVAAAAAKLNEFSEAQALNNTKCNGIVRYKRNAVSEVNAVEFPIDSEKYNVAVLDSDRLFIIKNSAATDIRYLNAAAFDGFVGVKDSTKFIMVPTDRRDKDAKFSTLQKSEAVDHNVRRRIVAYGTDTKTIMADYVSIVTESEVDFAYTNLMAVTNITTEYYEDDTVYKIEGSVKKMNTAGFETKDFYVKDMSVVDNAKNIEGKNCTLSKGDVITYSKSNIDGYVNGIYVLYDAETNSIGTKNIMGYTNGTTELTESSLISFSDSPRRAMMGYVYSYEDGNMIVTTQPIKTSSYDTTKQAGASNYRTEIYMNQRNNIMYLDLSGKKVNARWAEDTDIKSYQTYSADCSEVLALTAGQGVSLIVVINK